MGPIRAVQNRLIIVGPDRMAVRLGVGVDLIDYNFCEQLPSSLSGYVWSETDLDQVFDRGESAIPGVLVESDPTRLGNSGFEIRGIGGNRVTTRIDGVPTPEQFDFGPFGVTRQALDIDVLPKVQDDTNPSCKAR